MIKLFGEPEVLSHLRRRALLPWWIKFFCWVFMLLAVVGVLCNIDLFFGNRPAISLYGIDADVNFPFNLMLLVPVFVLNGYTGYLLWFEKDKAIFFGKISVIVGIVLCLTSFIIYLIDGDFTVRLELILLALTWWWLSRVQPQWEALK